jgi:hypothetical protein
MFGVDAPKYSIGKEPRSKSKQNGSIPGPGNYEILHRFGDGPKISMSFVRPQSSKASNVPGPGQYEKNDIQKILGGKYKYLI